MTKAKLESENLSPSIMEDAPQTPVFRHFSDVLSAFHGHINADPDTTSDTAVSLAVVKVESDLIKYFSSDEGRRDIQDSPQHGKSPEAVVALLMEDVIQMGRAEVIKRSLSREIHKEGKSNE